MNTLYKILYPGSYIPWGTILLYYLLHARFFDLLACLTYVIISLICISHSDYNKTVMHWESLHRICDFALIVRLILLNTLDSSFISLVFAIAICLIGGKLMKEKHRFVLTQPILYGVCALFLCSSSYSRLQQVSVICVTILKMGQSGIHLTCNSENELEDKLRTYFRIKIAETYLLFLMEWSSISNIHWISLPIIIFVSGLFQAMAYYDVPCDCQNLEEFYVNMNKLPENYPMPLNFRHARERSKVFSQVFKYHDI